MRRITVAEVKEAYRWQMCVEDYEYRQVQREVRSDVG